MASNDEYDSRRQLVGAATLIALIVDGNLDQVAQLLNGGVDADVPDQHGFPPLHVAAGYGHAEIVELLLSRGANVNSRNVEGGTALHLAANGHADVVSVLLANSANVDLANANRVAAIHVAVQGSHVDVVRMLVDSGADVASRLSSGETPLEMALEDNFETIAGILRAAGA